MRRESVTLNGEKLTMTWLKISTLRKNVAVEPTSAIAKKRLPKNPSRTTGRSDLGLPEASETVDDQSASRMLPVGAVCLIVASLSSEPA